MLDLPKTRWSTTTRVLLSHANAGALKVVDALDDFRTLSPTGWVQAERIAERLENLDLRCLLSSPSLRCRQTLIPLARALGLDIEPVPALSRSASVDALLELLSSDATHGAVLCTHPSLVVKTLDRIGQVTAAGRDPRRDETDIWLIQEPGWSRPEEIPPLASQF